MLTGELAPDAGSVRLGANLEIATLDQKRAAVDPAGDAGAFPDRRPRREPRHQRRGAPRRLLHEGLPVQAGAGAHAGARAFRRRTGAADPGARAGAPGQSSGARRADQRPRHGDAGTAAGAGRRLCRHGDPGQPRPRFPRPHRDQHHRAGRRRPLDRICRRLFRHAGAARRHEARRSGQGMPRRTAARREPARRSSPTPKAPAQKLSFKQKFALENLPKKMAAVSASISALEDSIADPAFYKRDPGSFQKTIAALDKERETLRASRRNGWNSKCCARRWKAADASQVQGRRTRRQPTCGASPQGLDCPARRQPLPAACQAFSASSNTFSPGMPFSIVNSARRPDL